MRYRLGYLDKYPIETTNSWLENVPMFSATLKRPVDPIRLEEAVRKAISVFPLFKTYFHWDKEYFLETNDKPLVILKCKEDERPEFFGENTNGYPWRVSYYENTIRLEWNHGVTDGAGSQVFFQDLLRAYFGLEPVEKSHKFLVAPGIEPFYNTKEKGDNYLKEPAGYKHKYLPRLYQRNKTCTHYYEGKTEEIVKTARLCGSTVAPLIASIYARAVRKHIDPKAKNKNVACNITIDVRKTLNYESMHNCVDMKRFTYIDEFENMNIAQVAKIYSDKLKHSRKEKNIIRSVTERVSVFKLYHILHFKHMIKLAVKIYGLIARDTDCNFVLSYLGKVNLPDEVISQIDNFDFKLCPDVGECIVSCIDFNGRFNIRVNSDYVDEEGINKDFVELCSSVGIHLEDQGKITFRQSRFKGE